MPVKKSEAREHEVAVTFLPDSRRTLLADGDRLLQGAWRAGIGIKSACGGRGKCGSCLVHVASAAPGALSPPSA